MTGAIAVAAVPICAAIDGRRCWLRLWHISLRMRLCLCLHLRLILSFYLCVHLRHAVNHRCGLRLAAVEHAAQLRREVACGEVIRDGDEAAVPELVAVIQRDAGAGQVHRLLDALSVGQQPTSAVQHLFLLQHGADTDDVLGVEGIAHFRQQFVLHFARVGHRGSRLVRQLGRLTAQVVQQDVWRRVGANLQHAAAGQEVDHGAAGVAVHQDAKGELAPGGQHRLEIVPVLQQRACPQHKLLATCLRARIRPNTLHPQQVGHGRRKLLHPLQPEACEPGQQLRAADVQRLYG
mmetsp:Transcript_35180/g.90007  ORF Transcript_35180/g.90007 Transcript_35180/m.90007 type:complete len:292 (-) Transcript_35180:1071-1946(-)